jgi:hypothetical protein
VPDKPCLNLDVPLMCAMKIIISHDVDHLSIHEHWLRDLFIPKWLVKTFFYMITGRLPLRVGVRRLLLVFQGTFNRLDEVMAIDRAFGIPSTFFVGMRNGLGMSYSLKAAKQTVRRIQQEGFAVDVHGVAFDDARLINEEHARFTAIIGSDQPFGVRNHYLRRCSKTPTLQKAAGYRFDSSEYGLKPPYVVDGMIEFPVCLMDSYLLSDCRNDLEDVKRRTLAAFAEAERLGLPFFTLIFHDPYYSELFPVHQAWYRWLVKYLKDHYELTDFARAGQQLKGI